MRIIGTALAALLAVSASAQTLRPDQQAFHDLYKELVETNTTLSVGSCTVAAAQIGAPAEGGGLRRRRHHLFPGA